MLLQEPSSTVTLSPSNVDCVDIRMHRGKGGGGRGNASFWRATAWSSRPKSFDQACFIIPRGTLYNILYRDAPPEKGTFFRLQIIEG